MKHALFRNRPLFKECIEILNIDLLSDEQSDQLSQTFKRIFPITKWGKIDWNKIDNKIAIGTNSSEIIPVLEKLLGATLYDKTAYVEWSTASIPVIKSNLDDIIRYFDDVSCVAIEKFIFNSEIGYIIEVLHSDEITIGLLKTFQEF